MWGISRENLRYHTSTEVLKRVNTVRRYRGTGIMAGVTGEQVEVFPKIVKQTKRKPIYEGDTQIFVQIVPAKHKRKRKHKHTNNMHNQ